MRELRERARSHSGPSSVRGTAHEVGRGALAKAKYARGTIRLVVLLRFLLSYLGTARGLEAFTASTVSRFPSCPPHGADAVAHAQCPGAADA